MNRQEALEYLATKIPSLAENRVWEDDGKVLESKPLDRLYDIYGDYNTVLEPNAPFIIPALEEGSREVYLNSKQFPDRIHYYFSFHLPYGDKKSITYLTFILGETYKDKQEFWLESYKKGQKSLRFEGFVEGLATSVYMALTRLQGQFILYANHDMRSIKSGDVIARIDENDNVYLNDILK